MATARSDQHRKASASSGRTRARSSSDGRRPLQQRDTGYRVGSSRRQKVSPTVNPRFIIFGVVGILVVIAMIFGITSCVRGCSSKKQAKKQEEETVQVNPDDERVAFGVSSEETAKLSAVLDRNEAFAKIAQNADKITDERLIDLAIAEPDAVAFVAGSLDSNGSSAPFDEPLSQGEYPRIYTFDARWGYVPFADGIVGATGSGPVALSIASMGLSGKNTYDPATIAETISSSKLASGTTGMDDSFVTNHAGDVGLTATSVEASSDGIYSPISESQPVLIKLKSDSGVGSPNAHWALITQLNSDNSITLLDPTSVSASSHSWSLGAISSRTDTAYALGLGSGASMAGSSGSTSSGSDSLGMNSSSGSSSSTSDTETEL